MSLPISDRDVRAGEKRREFFDGVAGQHAAPGPFKRYYNARLKRVVKFNVPKGSSVLEFGCGVGDLLAELEPARGVGVDFSDETLQLARQRHPDLEFMVADAGELATKDKFDYIILSNLVGDLVDVQRVLERIPELCHDRTRVVITHFNYLWGPAVKLAEQLGIKPRQREQNWLELEDLENLLELAGLEPVKSGMDMLLPLPLSALSDIVNDYVGTLPGLARLCVNQLVLARPIRKGRRRDCKVSVIVACKDERGNIEELVRTTPKMGKGTEMIFVDGHSDDGTVEEIERCIAAREELNADLDDVRVFVQPGKGKGDAVRLGFEEARGDVLMILDADITVRPEDLPKFYDALIEGKGEFINGSRLVYPMEDQAMRFLNMLGNHFFGWVFSWLLDQRLTDTLCGTKVLFKRDYEAIKRGREFFGDFDPFGDFDLLFGAAKQNMLIREVPIRYRNREYGEIKIDRFRHGVLLLQMSALAFKRFKLHQGVT
ncbi:MAG: glycosyltransferase [Deltaproteobacteria bacterium]|nr:glycosyltransferase [Deltaproteobacteria bacterium]